MIFNNGKYKSLLAAQEGELAQLQQIVDRDHHFRPSYHIAPPTGLLNDPNGLIFDGEHYHVFYQWFPFDALHGMKHWKQLITKDFIHYQTGETLIPTELFESHGCYSGGALPLDERHFAVFYTGNTRRAADNQRVPYQNLAIFRKDGGLVSKRVLLDSPPPGYTEHVRDPKPFYTADGKIRFVCGAQRENLSGTAIVFEMDNLDSPPRLIGEIALPQFDNRGVFMWECPDLFKLGEKDVFVWSPQGKAREAHQYQNNYHAVYAVGKLSGLNFEAEHMAELDQGFDFYAPQSFAGLSKQQQTLLYSWVGLPDLTYPTDEYKWHSMLSLPREVRLKNGKFFQQPAPEIYQNLTALQPLTVSDQTELADLDRAYLRFDADNRPFRLSLFANAQGQSLILRYENGLFCLDRSQTEQTALMQQFGSQRYCELQTLNQVEIFLDRSVIEIFLNGGEKVLTSRFFIADRKNFLKTDRTFHIEIGYPEPIQMG